MMVLQYVSLVIRYNTYSNNNNNNNNISNNNYDLWFSIKAGRQAVRRAGELNNEIFVCG